jgi:hypothetical protein
LTGGLLAYTVIAHQRLQLDLLPGHLLMWQVALQPHLPKSRQIQLMALVQGCSTGELHRPTPADACTYARQAVDATLGQQLLLTLPVIGLAVY